MVMSRALHRQTELLLISNEIDRRCLNALGLAAPNLLEALKTARSALKYWAPTTGMVTDDLEPLNNFRLMAHSLAAIRRAAVTYPSDIAPDAPLNADLLTTDERRELAPPKKQGRCIGKRQLELAKEIERTKQLSGDL